LVSTQFQLKYTKQFIISRRKNFAQLKLFCFKQGRSTALSIHKQDFTGLVQLCIYPFKFSDKMTAKFCGNNFDICRYLDIKMLISLKSENLLYILRNNSIPNPVSALGIYESLL